MADQWIEARTALEIVGNPLAICERCHAGMIRARAKLVRSGEEKKSEAKLPPAFWWAEGHDALAQNWTSGDFSTWLDKNHLQAFGVSFALDDVLGLVPFDQQAAIRRRLSVAGSPEWVSAREARRFAYNDAGISPASAAKTLIEQCRLGFITGRAIEMRAALAAAPDDWAQEAREWDIQLWFWRGFCSTAASTQDWETGTFAGEGHGPDGIRWITLNGVHFLRASLEVLRPQPACQDSSEDEQELGKPRLSDGALSRWWDKLGAAREALSQAQLWTLAKTDHPESSIARDRIRALTEGRTPGPKRNSAEIDR